MRPLPYLQVVIQPPPFCKTADSYTHFAFVRHNPYELALFGHNKVRKAVLEYRFSS